MLLERDIVEKIEQTFSPEDAPKVIELLSAADKFGCIARCIVLDAKGNLQTMRDYIQWTDQMDSPDVSAWMQDKGSRNLSGSFLIDAREKMWISQVAGAMAQRDYVLSSLITYPPDKSDPMYESKPRDGTVTFEGDLGQLCVSRKQEKWTLNGDQGDLEVYGFNKAFKNEQEFRDAISGYILTKRRPMKNILPRSQ